MRRGWSGRLLVSQRESTHSTPIAAELTPPAPLLAFSDGASDPCQPSCPHMLHASHTSRQLALQYRDEGSEQLRDRAAPCEHRARLLRVQAGHVRPQHAQRVPAPRRAHDQG